MRYLCFLGYILVGYELRGYSDFENKIIDMER